MRKQLVCGLMVAGVSCACGEAVSPALELAPAVHVRLAQDSIFAGDTVRITAVATGDDSAAVAWPAFNWTSSDASVARVDPTGLVLGWSRGTAYIVARMGTLRDSIAVRVGLRDAGIGTAFGSMSAGDGMLCALTTAGIPYCAPTAEPASTIRFERLAGADTLPLAALAASLTHQCGINWEHKLYCWGDNAAGQLMTGTNAQFTGPVPGGDGSRFSAVAVAAEPSHTCGIEESTNVVMCAGANGNGQLGRLGTAQSTTVQPVANQLLARRIGAAGGRSCALSLEGELWCWGRGSGTTTPTRIPSQPLAELSVGGAGVCALTTTGAALCGAFASALTPVAAELRFSQILSGSSRRQVGGTVTSLAFVCGLTTDGELYCWGDFPPLAASSWFGTARFAPVHLMPGVTFRSLGANEYHVCGVTTDNELVCL